ncbi:hypothetical protein RFI_37979, partial [Reticulomyxa filosa]
ECKQKGNLNLNGHLPNIGNIKMKNCMNDEEIAYHDVRDKKSEELDKSKNVNKNDHIHMRETELQEKKSNNWNNLFSIKDQMLDENNIDPMQQLQKQKM